MRDSARRTIEGILEKADVRIDGDRPWDIRVLDTRFFRRVLSQGSLGAGESWMDNWWDCRALDQFFERILRLQLERRIRLPWKFKARAIVQRVFNAQSRARAFLIGESHYNIGPDLFPRMLDRRMVYSCGYWKDADNLDDAQEAKLELICRKLGLQPGMRFLDIGCGWGSLVQYAAEKYGVEAVGVTVSEDQAQEARKRCKDLPVEIRLADYRELDEPFDRIASVGMVEHVGWKNYRTYMKTAWRCLKPGGLFLLHTIGSNHSARHTDPWIAKYIFPNSHLPSLAQLARAAEGLFTIEDLHSFGPDYDRTLMAWHANLLSAWPEISANYDERFRRMWSYYLLSCAAAFRVRRIHLWQILLAKPPRPSVTVTIR